MKLFRCLCVVYIALLVEQVSAQQPVASTPEQQAIEATARAFVEAYDAGNAEAVAALWTPDGEYIIGQQTLKGRPAIQQLYKEFFTAHPGSKMQVKIDSVRTVAPNVVLEQGIASVSNSPSGPESASSYSAIHVKQNGKWQMASVRESDIPLPAATQSLEQLTWLIGDWSAQGETARVDVKYDWLPGKNFLRGTTTLHTHDDAPAIVPGGMQIIGKDALSGQIVSWFFNADGGHGHGVWNKSGDRWLIHSQGATAEGAVTTATNVFYRADDIVLSWQSVNRAVGGQPLPNTKEIVLERVSDTKPAN